YPPRLFVASAATRATSRASMGGTRVRKPSRLDEKKSVGLSTGSWACGGILRKQEKLGPAVRRLDTGFGQDQPPMYAPAPAPAFTLAWLVQTRKTPIFSCCNR